jgi:hypothetical protein
MLATGCEDLTPSRNMPQTVSVSVSDIGEASAICHLSVTPKGATQKSGVIYGTDPLLQAGTLEATTSGSDVDVVTLSSLDGGITYYLRPYAADRLDARVYGDIQSFTTVKATTLSLSPSSIDAASTAGSYKLTITGNDAWTITSDQSWCTVQPTSGTGNGEVTVSVQENTTSGDRSAVLTVTSGSMSKQVNLLQQWITLTEFGNGITAASSFGGGNGTQSNPYLISDARHLKKLVDNTNNSGRPYQNTYFKLTTDIRVTADEWTPIAAPDNHSFSGAFDGDGHTISGTMRSARYQYFGLFGYLRGVTISNLNIAATVENRYASTTGGPNTGALAGVLHEESNVRNCNISGSVTGGTGDCQTGGVAGSILCSSTVRDCNISATVRGGRGNQGYSNTGGVAGDIWSNCESVEILNCTVSGSIIGGDATGYSTRTGGITGITGWVGGHIGVNITNCTISASGSVTSGNNLGDGGVDVAGIVGWMGGEEDVINGCTNNASITRKDGNSNGTTGGLVGGNFGKIHTSLNTGNVSGLSDSTGGLVGYNYNYSPEGQVYSCCTNRGYVNGQSPSNENQVGGGPGVTPCPDGHTKR